MDECERCLGKMDTQYRHKEFADVPLPLTVQKSTDDFI